MERTIDKIEQLQERIKRFQTLRDESSDLDIEDLEMDSLEDDELRSAMEVGKKLKFNMAHLDLDRWLKDLKKDKDQLYAPYLSAKDVTPDRDAKLAKLKELIAEKVESPTINKQGKLNHKVIVFTHFADTADYIYESIKEWATKELSIHIAKVVGGSGNNKMTLGKSRFDNILTNFSPISKERDKIPRLPQEEEIDLLIATDCLSEGQNLQDCDYLINYDIHWNPVRIIQRFGRIDRIGSRNESVQLVNFWPTPDLNKYIRLKGRVEARMALVDITAAQGDNLLDPDEIEDVIEDELKYRDKQLLRLKDEVLDLEDFNETVSLNEFTLDDFRVELSKYISANRELLQNAPLGLYTVVPSSPDYQVIRPGVIFCLKQIGDSTGNEKINPLQPYFLVYVRDDGNVRFTFAQPKQILEIFRTLCLGQDTPYEELCTLFDQETDNGKDMEKYNQLLEKAIRSCARSFQKRAIGNLLSGRGGVLPKREKQVDDKTDFELITWLVIK